MQYIKVYFLLIVVFILGGCQNQVNNTRNFPPEALLLPKEFLPENWNATPPKPMGPATIGFGDESDRYLNFTIKDSQPKLAIASHYVLHFKTPQKAQEEFKEMFPQRFNSNSIAVDSPWTSPPTLNYSSSYADQYHLACMINNVAGVRQVCEVMAQYEEFIIIFHSIIVPEVLTLDGFEQLVEAIDKHTIALLELENNQSE